MASALSSLKAPSSKAPLFQGQNNLSAYGVETPQSTENETAQEGLAYYVKKQFDRAVAHRRNIGIDERLTRNLYANKCEYSPDQLALVDPDTQVYVGICALKAQAAQAWLRDIILNNIDKPWMLTATPIPELPEDMTERVIDLLMMELSQLGSVEEIRDRAKQLKTVALDEAKEEADKAIKKMELVIDDQMAQNAFRLSFTQLIQDISIYPATFIRGPFITQKKVATWKNNTYSAKLEKIPDCRVINPFDAFPSPSSTTAADGEFFCERAKLSHTALYNMIGVESFDETNIRRALAEYCDGYGLELSSDSARDSLEEKDQDTVRDGTEIDTIIYNGLIPGKFLIEHKILVPDPQKHYEAEIWVAGDYVVRATLNPEITDERLIYSTSYIKSERSPWGRSVIDLVYDLERICNASVRSLVKNMAFASGPIVEADSARIEGDPRDLYPYKVFLVTPDMTGNNGPAIRFNKVESISGELKSIYEYFSKVADDLSGIPAYVLGNPQVAGAGRTMGGLSMLMGNAAKGIKNVQLNIDRDIIGPIIKGFYSYNMLTSDDPTIKADAQIIASGATGLLQRELSQARLVEILQLLAPFIPVWDTMPDGLKILLREVLKQTGLPVDRIIEDPNASNVLMGRLQELTQAEGFFRGTSSPVPLPPQSQPPMPPGASPNLPAGAANVDTRSMPLAAG
jgi:antitoxin component of RelBE/YafQ-DinJ toxin-antitoxin module